MTKINKSTDKQTNCMWQSPPWEANSSSVKKIPSFYETKDVIVFTTACHMSLSKLDQSSSCPPHPTF